MLNPTTTFAESYRNFHNLLLLKKLPKLRDFYLDFMNDFGTLRSTTTSTYFEDVEWIRMCWKLLEKRFKDAVSVGSLHGYRLPHRPQTRVGGATVFGDTIQIDIFHLQDTLYLLIIDEATRYKMCQVLPGQDSEQILEVLLKSCWDEPWVC